MKLCLKPPIVVREHYQKFGFDDHDRFLLGPIQEQANFLQLLKVTPPNRFLT